MKRIALLLGFGILAATMSLAQDTAGTSTASGTQDHSTQSRTQSSTARTNVIRGCLSGSSGNYTVTDPNGMQYEVNGDDATLRSMVGREVEITLSENRSTEDATQGSGAASHASNSVQASDVRAVSSSCNMGGSTGTPKGTPETTEPPKPQMMAMLQQQSTAGQGVQAPDAQATPPVTSQTPATQASPTTGSNSQMGTSPANNNGTTNSQNGQTTGQGVDNQGANNPSTNANPPTSPNAAAPSSNTQQPQSNAADDQNKPLYERQATDIPWANSSGRNTGTTPPPH